MFGAGELLKAGAAEIFLDLVVGGKGLLGERGELAGDDREEHLGRLRSPGLGTGARPEQTPSSSGSGPSIDPPLAELTPDIAETEIRSSPGGFWIREFCIAA